MNRLLIYNSGGSASNLKAAADVFYAYPGATVKDINGLTGTPTGTLYDWIETLVDDTYDEIFICCTSSAATTTGTMPFDRIASLRVKMKVGKKGTVVNSGTCQANATVTEIKLAATASAVNDAYKAMFIETTGTTAVSRYISGYVGATTTATTLTTTTAITTTETYEVYTNDYIYEVGNTNATSGKTPVLQAWDIMFPDITYPAINAYIGGYKFAMASGTAQAINVAGQMTLSATVDVGNILTQTEYDVDDALVDMYLYVYSATTGAAQYAKITAYNATSRVATFDAAMGILPTGTAVYRIVATIDEVLYDKAAELMISTYMYTCNAAAVRAINQKLIDNDGTLLNLGTTEVGQDLDYLWNDFLYRGKSIFLADALAVV